MTIIRREDDFYQGRGKESAGGHTFSKATMPKWKATANAPTTKRVFPGVAYVKAGFSRQAHRIKAYIWHRETIKQHFPGARSPAQAPRNKRQTTLTKRSLTKCLLGGGALVANLPARQLAGRQEWPIWGSHKGIFLSHSSATGQKNGKV
ncbi:MAG: hypothetical protein KDD10_07895, partial [Phaeodactylibacter sp.]|nr:hypothetical protein [Phaeodactylibacter sp.]